MTWLGSLIGAALFVVLMSTTFARAVEGAYGAIHVLAVYLHALPPARLGPHDPEIILI